MPKKRIVSTEKLRALPRRPEWLRAPLPSGEGYNRLKRLTRTENLHTVCESAACPNIGECWNRGTLTFMILGGECTRSCRFCDVPLGAPKTVDWDEPARVAGALSALKLRHAVITSVNRDDLEDEGAGVWAETIRRVREACPGMTVETLVPDFHAREDLIARVCAAGPDIFAHNLETVESLQAALRPQACYQTSLKTLSVARRFGMRVKSGLMLGLGETETEILHAMDDLRGAGCEALTLGQYLRPSLWHLEVKKHYAPAEFENLKREAERRGFRRVTAGPLVRSSYYADAAALP